MAITALVTGFGPFPGAPFNPTGPLVERLAHLRRPGLADVKIIPFVFPTSYAAVDRELPKMISKYKPDMLLMFGLAPRARTVRVETRARNALALLPDVSGRSLGRRVIAAGAPSAMSLRTPTRPLLAAFRAAHVATVLSRDAGRYLCNFLCWRAIEAARKNGPRVIAFVHIPPIPRTTRPLTKHRKPGLADLTRAGSTILITLAAATRHV
ncbi:MAG: pyroglutamyl-peptidase I [Pseudolabrys sp.]